MAIATSPRWRFARKDLAWDYPGVKVLGILFYFMRKGIWLVWHLVSAVKISFFHIGQLFMLLPSECQDGSLYS